MCSTCGLLAAPAPWRRARRAGGRRSGAARRRPRPPSRANATGSSISACVPTISDSSPLAELAEQVGAPARRASSRSAGRPAPASPGISAWIVAKCCSASVSVGRHQRALVAVLDGAQQRVQRDHGLARADLAHQQPLHRPRLARGRASISSSARCWSPVSGERQHRRPASGRSARARRRAPARRRRSRRSRRRRSSASCTSSSSSNASRRRPTLLLAPRAPGSARRAARRARSGQPLARAQPRRQRLEHVGDRAGVRAHQRQDLGRGQALGRRVVRDRAAAAGRLGRRARGPGRGSGCAPRTCRAGPAASRPGSVCTSHGWLKNVAFIDAGVVGDGRLDQRPHPAPAHRARGDAAHLDDHGRALARRRAAATARASRRSRGRCSSRSPTVSGPSACGRLLGLGALERQRPAQPRRPRVAHRGACSSSSPGESVAGRRRTRWRTSAALR